MPGACAPVTHPALAHLPPGESSLPPAGRQRSFNLAPLLHSTHFPAPFHMPVLPLPSLGSLIGSPPLPGPLPSSRAPEPSTHRVHPPTPAVLPCPLLLNAATSATPSACGSVSATASASTRCAANCQSTCVTRLPPALAHRPLSPPTPTSHALPWQAPCRKMKHHRSHKPTCHKRSRNYTCAGESPRPGGRLQWAGRSLHCIPAASSIHRSSHALTFIPSLPCPHPPRRFQALLPGRPHHALRPRHLVQGLQGPLDQPLLPDQAPPRQPPPPGDLRGWLRARLHLPGRRDLRRAGVIPPAGLAAPAARTAGNDAASSAGCCAALRAQTMHARHARPCTHTNTNMQHRHIT